MEEYSINQIPVLSGDVVPDTKTLWLFKESLKKGRCDEILFCAFGGYLEQPGLTARQGTVVDARIVSVPKQCNPRKRKPNPQRGPDSK